MNSLRLLSLLALHVAGLVPSVAAQSGATQQAYIKASNTDPNGCGPVYVSCPSYAGFGLSVAVSGDTAVIGAYGERSGSTGVNGNQFNIGADYSGAAYVFVRSGGVWTQQAYLKASNTGAYDQFGYAVAVSGDTIVVGAPAEDSSANGVNGPQGDESARDSGAAYVFIRNGATWTQQAYLKASNTGQQDFFGISVSVSGDTIVVGADREDSDSLGINGAQGNNNATDRGAVYVFARSAGVWAQQTYLKSSMAGGSNFGTSVCLDGDTLVAGEPGRSFFGGLTDAGAAYVFVRAGGVWSQQAFLSAPAPGSHAGFGWSVGVSGDTIAIGAPRESTGNLSEAGAAYVFARNVTAWALQARITASNIDAGDWFGESVSVSGNRMIAGARKEDSSATGINGDQSLNSGPDAGAAYVFGRCGTEWNQDAYLKASNAESGDMFGISVAVYGDHGIVGAYGERSLASGVNGNQSSNQSFEAGAAYAYSGLSVRTGRVMSVLAPPQIGHTASFSLTYPSSATGNLYAFLASSSYFASCVPISVPGLSVLGGALIDPSSSVSAFSGLLGASGTISHNVAVPNSSSFLGYRWDLQSVDVDIAGRGILFSDNALRLVISDGGMPSHMVPIAPGTFQMGATQGQPNEAPVHTVTVSRPFWMSRYEVTQIEYQALMGSNPSYFQGASWGSSANRPVESVSWGDAMAYCAALTAQEAAASRLPSGYQYRLPTEAEWEYCCRASTSSEWSVGNTLTCADANVNSNGFCVPPGQTTPVGSYPDNPWGICDMHGSVSEWCLDSWDRSNNYPAGVVVDPYVTSGPRGLIRGGGWANPPSYSRSAFRDWYNPSGASWNLGFRVVLAPVLVP